MVEHSPTEHALASRIQRIESFLLTALAVSSGFLIVIGLFLPVASFTSMHRYAFSIVDLGTWAFAPASHEFERNYGGDIGWILAALTTLAFGSALLALVDMALDRGSRAKLIWVRVSSVASAVCAVAIGWVLLTVEPSAGETRSPEMAVWPLLIGLAILLITAFSTLPHSWWENRQGATQSR